MKSVFLVPLTTMLLTGAVLPTYAESLLGGVLGGDGDRSLVTISEGDASDSGLINLGLGGDDSIVDANVGGRDSQLVDANVGTGNGLTVDANVGGSIANANAAVGGSRGLVDASVDLLDRNVSADVNVGGRNLVDVGVEIGGGGNGNNGNNGGNGNNGNNGNGGNNSNNGNTANNGNNGNSGNPGLPGGPGRVNGVASNGGVAGCVGESPAKLAQLVQSTRVDASWTRASNIAIKPVMVCPDVKVWLSGQLAGSGMGPAIQNAVLSDPLISASLSRSSYDAQRVFAVKASGSQLTVFVY